MISTKLGTVKFTQPDYSLGNKECVEEAVKIILKADLSCILDALIDQYGLIETLEMWTDVAEKTVEERNNA